MNLRSALAAATALAGVLLTAVSPALANGPCAQTPDTVKACVDAIQNSGVVVNDVFKDANGHTGDQLPVYGKLYNQWAGCSPYEVNPGCAGTSTAPYTCPGAYSCASPGGAFTTASTFVNALDHLWWQPCRLADPTLVNQGGTMCPANWACIADQVGGNYYPWEGLVFDLGGPSNKVVIFAQNDHGPQPCESLEYTVFLTDNPKANQLTDVILDPKTTGVDPMKWNRAVLSKIYTWGWFNGRAPDPVGHASCGDTANYAVEDDAFSQVFSLPCGVTFRYASIVAGNDGLDFPACGYDSSEAELDAVAGLTESGAGVCPDKDGDHYVDCACPTAPPICDCNDSDPKIHPGAPEACDSPDLNCDGIPGSCPAGLLCYLSNCQTPCSGGENPFCPPGTKCQPAANDHICVPVDCNCSAGQVCINNVCMDACAKVSCPGKQICQDGHCFDPCANIVCPAGQLCEGGTCVFPCGCFAGDVGCVGGTTCDNGMGGSNTCVQPTCKGVECPAGQTCEASTGTCVDFCSSGVQCPAGQHCVAPDGCVPVCKGVMCPDKSTCDPVSGKCVDMSCVGVTCFAPQTCVGGACVTADGGTDGGDTDGGGGTGGASSGTHGSASGGAGGAGGNGVGAKGKCGCRVVGDPDEAPLSGAGVMALVGLAAAAARRRASKRG